MQWRCRRQRLECTPPIVMGILNVTPDSFSDGGQHLQAETAIEHARKMLEQGAAIIDVGGESTRPGATPVDAVTEIKRVLPVVTALVDMGALISIDTTKAEVARAALEAGASIVNDVSAMTIDPEMPAIVRQYEAGVVLMHMQGTPRTMQTNPAYQNVVQDIRDWLDERATEAIAAGIPRDQIAIDPGIGFGKTLEHNLDIIANLNQFSKLGFPVLMGMSRKRFIGDLTETRIPQDRLAGSLAALTASILQGAHVLRVHDVAPSVAATKLAHAIREHQQPAEAA